MARRTHVPAAVVACDCCPNRLMESEATISRRALSGAVLCSVCRMRARSFATVHQVPAGCSVVVRGTGYGLWSAVLTAPDGREFTSAALTDHRAVACARAAAVAAGALNP